MKITIHDNSAFTVSNRDRTSAAKITSETSLSDIDNLAFDLRLTSEQLGKLVQIVANDNPRNEAETLNISVTYCDQA